MKRIRSFEVDHDKIVPGLYISRIDGDVTTYDMRTRTPNAGDYMDNVTMHTFEHMFATFIRNSDIGGDVIYFGPMGCRTGFYLLVRNADDTKVIENIKAACRLTAGHNGEVFGASRKECGNYLELELSSAQIESRRYLEVIKDITANDLAYPN